MKKGDIVLVKATVRTGYAIQQEEEEIAYRVNHTKGKHLLRLKEIKPWRGMVSGYSFRYTGIYYRGWTHDYEQEPPSLGALKAHKVWLIQPLDTDRWVGPISCLEEDLELYENEKGT